MGGIKNGQRVYILCRFAHLKKNLKAMPPLDKIIVAEAFAKGGDERSMSFCLRQNSTPLCDNVQSQRSRFISDYVHKALYLLKSLRAVNDN